ncbi:imidazole glycerol phosphate synthase subunit HisH [Sphingomonas lacunae]|uniref:imidazole glycerol phosphate synthase subunit HisH n=1 Tax=Sphingomonas lacunae TaxID=2698828 RepID=UPI001FEC168A|nr:imidazole glycerol phosphate synthase subunit HisH [Sphingomonas lacunae]
MGERIALIDYGAGNLRSVANALRAAGAAGVIVTSNPAIVAAADRIVLPGVGAFAHCRDALAQVEGLVEALNQRVRRDGVPFLGICVGMQLLADVGEEHGQHQGLGWIPGTVRMMRPADPEAKVPHMGWNDVRPVNPHPLIVPGEAYFLHSFHMEAADPADVIAISDHGGPIVAAVARNNVAGVQYHPEKSQAYGIATIERFLAWRP